MRTLTSAQQQNNIIQKHYMSINTTTQTNIKVVMLGSQKPATRVYYTFIISFTSPHITYTCTTHSPLPSPHYTSHTHVLRINHYFHLSTHHTPEHCSMLIDHKSDKQHKSNNLTYTLSSQPVPFFQNPGKCSNW